MKKPYDGSSEATCPLRGGKLCERVCPTCNWFRKVVGTNRNTGEPLDKWDCAIPMLVFVQIEGNQFTREVSAEVEAMRNEAAKIQLAVGSSVSQLTEAVRDRSNVPAMLTSGAGLARLTDAASD